MMEVLRLRAARARRDCTPGEEASRLKGKVVGRLGVGKLRVKGVALGTRNRLSWGGVIGGKITNEGSLVGVGIGMRTGAV